MKMDPNLRQRVITAVGLAAGLFVVLFALPPLAVTLTFAALAALAGWEWGGLMRLDSPARVMYAFVLLLFCWQIRVGAPELVAVLLVLASIFWLLVVPLWLVRKWTLSGNDLFGYLVGLLVILPTWAAMQRLHAYSPWLLLAFMALVWVADIVAYFSGRRFGRHKLAPAISPGKTWEGAGGAVLGVLVYGGTLMAFAPSTLPLPWPLLVAGLLLLTVVSILGDLFESLLKRQAGLKDSSGLLPGHGGVLDRIDSLTSTLPLAALLLQLAQ